MSENENNDSKDSTVEAGPSIKKPKRPTVKMSKRKAPPKRKSPEMSGPVMATRSEQIDRKHLRALEPTYVPLKNDGWQYQASLWSSSSDDERRSYLYHMVLWSGVVMGSKRALQTVARYFAIDLDELKPYLDVMWMADVARTLKITEANLATFLHSDKDVGGKFHIGKQFAYQVNDPAHEDVDSVQSAPPQIVIQTSRTDPDDPNRREAEEMLRRRIASVTPLKAVKKEGE